MWLQRRREARGAVAVMEADVPVVVKVPEHDVHQPYITIIDCLSGQRLITVV